MPPLPSYSTCVCACAQVQTLVCVCMFACTRSVWMLAEVKKNVTFLRSVLMLTDVGIRNDPLEKQQVL